MRLMARTVMVDGARLQSLTTPFSSTETLASSREKQKVRIGDGPAHSIQSIDRNLLGLAEVEPHLSWNCKDLLNASLDYLYIAGTNP